MAVQIPHFDDPKEKIAWLRAKMLELATDHDNPAIEADRASLEAPYFAALEEAGLQNWEPKENLHPPTYDDVFVTEVLAPPAEPTE